MTEYDLTRRDALKALGAAGITVAGGAAALSWSNRDAERDGFGEHERETVHAVARVVYPSEVAGVREFVESYVVGRTADDPERATGMVDAVAALDAYTREWEDAAFVDVGPERRAETLRGMGVHVTDPDPHGDPRQRVRYYLVNELLFALYSSPTGGELVGIENPQGHPGGTASYRQPPET